MFSLSPDLINGLFESAGAICVWSNVYRLWKDRQVKGVNWWTVLFFWSWGLWNLWYYPTLAQWFSFCGGVALQLGNFAWLGMLLWISLVNYPVGPRRTYDQWLYGYVKKQVGDDVQ